ncbi:MAG TPA: O-antigen polymerase [Cyanobacteria bacterium UBA11149]|nr:O-antigen polymerase [Cyanobacteria bacterium UBA11367]HBE60935.1 O-antigen polymerase [Cyanobacteria bacterium UBA11366]HBK62437.1 O-antigen polymerase [Cyanobacteria bacterium UBA11166]HBR76397.1 O-antigen polymerase [Cyanobacteria bacterium UBA11159]HBS72052.1 O-antigen polymerase [Cyanobacteria bacterium UBA11153]HBW89747.1 O-antigen polymerase [Cyanobacteria bacterium UBA11149]HCA95465.1 O-antigen polymerase [Cyanobacteria bacterium UBA9226]
MNELIKWAEPKFAVLALLIFTGVLDIPSYNSLSDGVAKGAAGAIASGSPFEPLTKLLRYGIYLATILLIIARFKSVVRPAMRDPFLWALVGLALMSFIWSDFPDISRKEGFLTLLITLFGLYLASRYTLNEQLRIVAWTTGIAVVFSLLYTLALPGWGIEQGIHAGAWRGPLVQKNLFARLMAICGLPLLLSTNKTHKYRYIIWTIFGLAVMQLLFSDSKTALVAFLTLIILLPFYQALGWANSTTIPILITIVLLGASGGTWLISNWESFLTGLGRDTTLTGRTDIWAAVIDKIREQPWLGYGYKAFWQAGGGQDYVWYVFRFAIFTAHNGYIDLTAQLGLLGLSCFVLSFITAYMRALAWIRLGKTSEWLWPITYLTFIFMYNQSESTNIETNSFFWILYVAVTLSMGYVQMVDPDREELALSENEKLVPDEITYPYQPRFIKKAIDL